jgi:hypothetical protein
MHNGEAVATKDPNPREYSLAQLAGIDKTTK